MAKIKLKEWADKNNLSYLTANRHFHAGMIPGAIQLESGTILVEDVSPEQTMIGNTPNDAISLFLKKTVEFSKNNSTVEDFAAYVISNFQLKIQSTLEGPKYSKQKPKSEEVQKHFQQFIPKGEKPKPNTFVMEPAVYQDIAPATYPTDSNPDFNSQDLVKEFSKNISAASYAAASPTPTSTFSALYAAGVGATSPTDGMTTQSVDLNSTPQQINYTGSNGLTFGGSLTSGQAVMPTYTSANAMGGTFSAATVNGAAPGGIFDMSEPVGGMYFTNTSSNPDPVGTTVSTDYIGSFQPTQKELQSVKVVPDVRLNQPRGKRGRKPGKK